jgi:hypothetical protein
VEGLGDFLQARAKAEVATFAAEDLGRKLCLGPVAARQLSGQAFFPSACKALFPDGTSEYADARALTSGRFQHAIQDDLRRAPLTLLESSTLFSGLPNGARLRAIVAAIATDGLALPKSNAEVADFLSDLEQHARDASAIGNACATGAEKGLDLPCSALLFLRIAATSKDASASNGATWIERSAESFCKNYGAPDEAVPGGACLLGKSGNLDVDQWVLLRNTVDATSAFYNDLGKVQKQLFDAQATGKLSADLNVQAAAGVGSAFRELTKSLIQFASNYARKTRSTTPAVQDAVEAMSDVLEATAAISQRDSPAAASALRRLLGTREVASAMSADLQRGVALVLDLTDATTREEAQKVFEAYAAPASSYKAKYNSAATRLTLNAFVGILGGAQTAMVRRTESLNYKSLELVAFPPISAPVGLDISAPSSSSQHLGVTFALLDPLALFGPSASNTEVHLEGVLAPGLFVRWGMFKSPIMFLVGVRAQPLLKSSDRGCGAPGEDKACWQAPISALAGFAVDVPLVPLD